MPNLTDAKTAGNTHVQSGNYEKAIIEYTKGIDDPSNAKDDPVRHLVLGNRALCFLETKQYKKALQDALEATTLNPEYTKGWYRVAVAARAEQKDPTLVASYFQTCIDLDKNLQDAFLQRDEMLSLNENVNHVEMVAICNAVSVLRQVWFDCGLDDVVKKQLSDVSDDAFKQFLSRVAGDTLLNKNNNDDEDDSSSSIATISGKDDESVLHIAALLPRWNSKEIKSVSALLEFINSELSSVESGFDLVQNFIVEVQEKCQEVADARKSKKTVGDDDDDDGVDAWFAENCVFEGDDDDETNNKSSQHKQSLLYVYSMSGKPLSNIAGEDFSARVARVRNLKSDHGIVPHKNRRLGVQTSKILLFDILLPIINEWVQEYFKTSSPLPKNLSNHFFNNKNSVRDILRSGSCLSCLKSFVLDETTGSHIPIVDCGFCGAAFYCGKKCQEKAVTDYRHNFIDCDKNHKLDRKKVVCTALIGKLARGFREDGYGFMNRVKRDLFSLGESHVSSDEILTSKVNLVVDPDICTPENSDTVFKIPNLVHHNRQEWLKTIKRCTDWKKCEDDPYGNGDQSDIWGPMPGEPAQDLQTAWGNGMDTNQKFLSQFINWCSVGAVKKVSAALAALPDDEARKKAVNRRESLLRLSPLLHTVGGSRMHTGKITDDCDHFATARVLISCGADIDARDILGQSVISHCATSYASDISLKILIYICDTFSVSAETQNRAGNWTYQESITSNRQDVLRTLIMLGANPYRADRLGLRMLMGPSAQMMCPQLCETARKCLPNGKLKKGDLVAIQGLVRSKVLNGVVGKIEERLAGGKYQLKIPDAEKIEKMKSRNNDGQADQNEQQEIPSKSIAIPMENVTKAEECPNCDKLSDCQQFLCGKCRLGFCSEVCRLNHSWCYSDHITSNSSSSSSAEPSVPIANPCVLDLTRSAIPRGMTNVVTGAKPVLGQKALKDDGSEYFIIKVSIPVLHQDQTMSDLMRDVNIRMGRKKLPVPKEPDNALIYDASKNFNHTLTNKGGAKHSEGFLRMVHAVKEDNVFAGVKSFFWATHDKRKQELKVDVEVLPPPQNW